MNHREAATKPADRIADTEFVRLGEGDRRSDIREHAEFTVHIAEQPAHEHVEVQRFGRVRIALPKCGLVLLGGMSRRDIAEHFGGDERPLALKPDSAETNSSCIMPSGKGVRASSGTGQNSTGKHRDAVAAGGLRVEGLTTHPGLRAFFVVDRDGLVHHPHAGRVWRKPIRPRI